ncbi:hypothetical protein B2I21_09880 [Chryseobacterium mucoviscidosis]|nr:hypothetical protein B2I21_09880 [Chryseobacterium mucoviscidosis]
MSNDKVTACTHWVWTEMAAAKNPTYSRVGEPIWPHFKITAPKEWLDEGLIQDASDVELEGQTTIDDFI